MRVTYEAGDVDRLVKEALELRCADTLVAAGGDGTVNETVAALLKHTGKPCSVLPAATSFLPSSQVSKRTIGHPTMLLNLLWAAVHQGACMAWCVNMTSFTQRPSGAWIQA